MAFFRKSKSNKSLLNAAKTKTPSAAPSSVITPASPSDLADEFYVKYSEQLETLEHAALPPSLSKYTDIEKYKADYEAALQALSSLRNYCCRHKGGREWFSEMYEHCHNSRNADFSLVDEYESGYADLVDNFDAYRQRIEDRMNYESLLASETATIKPRILAIIEHDQGFIQKDLYASFDPALKSRVIDTLMELVKNGTITRKKYKNTFRLYTKSEADM